MKYIFMGFYGWPEDNGRQDSRIEVIRENFECWDLRKFSLEEFIETILATQESKALSESADNYVLRLQNRLMDKQLYKPR